jgi:hypothetical protein
MTVELALTLHDPENRMYVQAQRAIPRLVEIFNGIAIRPSAITNPGILTLFSAVDARLDLSSPLIAVGAGLGLARSQAVALALKSQASHVMYCDCDRVLHWAEYYPDELAGVAERLIENDFTVLGRTKQAFATHPQVQRDTEAIINKVFHLVSGWDWDVGAGARGLSRRAVETILAGCQDENLSNDVSWPLFLRAQGGFSFCHIHTEGLEFETTDRYKTEVEVAGDREAWIEQFDADPQRWLERLDLARGHVQAMMDFIEPPPSA